MTAYRLDQFTDIPHTLHVSRVRQAPAGRARWHYQLTAGDTVIFSGDDLLSPPGYTDGQAASAALGFLTLRPGDTDADYFDSDTPAQRAWRDAHAEDLSMALLGEDGSQTSDLSAYRVRAAGGPAAGPAGQERRCRCGHYFGQHEVRAGGWFGCYLTGCPCLDFTSDQAATEGESTSAADGEDGLTAPSTDAQFLGTCAGLAILLRDLAGQVTGWAAALAGLNLPARVLSPLHDAAQALTAAATAVTQAAAAVDEGDLARARQAAARGLRITGENPA